MQIEKIIFDGEDKYYLTVYVENDVENSRAEKVTVLIREFNHLKLKYPYSVTKFKNEESRYQNAIKESVTAFKNDKTTKELINWDGNL